MEQEGDKTEGSLQYLKGKIQKLVTTQEAQANQMLQTDKKVLEIMRKLNFIIQYNL